MKIIDLFRRKTKNPISTQPINNTSDLEKSQLDIVSPQMQKHIGAPERKITIAQLKKTLRQQKDKVQELEDATVEYIEKVKSVDDAMEQLGEQEKTLKPQEKEQAAFLTDSRISLQSKQDVKQNLKKIRKWLFDIKEAKAANKKSLGQLNDAIRQNERAIKVNKRAVRENERALKIVAESKEGEVELKAKGIEEMMKEMIPDEIQKEEQVKLSPPQESKSFAEPQIIVPPIETSGFGKMKEEDYWEKGKI